MRMHKNQCKFTQPKRAIPGTQEHHPFAEIREKPEEAAEILDVSLRHVCKTRKAYKDGGIAGIKAKLRGRRQGGKRMLTPEQEKTIQKIIVDKTPEQLRFKELHVDTQQHPGTDQREMEH